MAPKVKLALYASIVLSLICFAAIQHFIEPYHVYQLIGSYLFCFVAYTFWLSKAVEIKLWELLSLGLAFRLLMFSTPTLSDDFYRYYWDGKLLIEGLNPYLFAPNEIFRADVNDIKVAGKPLYDSLNSHEYYSVYPPLLQYIFAFGAWLGQSLNGFLAVLNALSLAAEVGTFFIIKKLLKLHNLKLKSLAIYWLNPLIIIELSGNLHTEVFMVLLISAAILFFKTNRYLLLGCVLALATLTKLYPVLFLPFFLLPFVKRNALLTVVAFGTTLIIFSLPIINLEALGNIYESVRLYYGKFEFNGSIYYLMRQLGYKLTGYNQIAIIGKILGAATLIGFFSLYLLRFRAHNKFDIPRVIYLGMLLFYFFSTTVMPWYLALIILASVFNNSKVGLVWSALIVLTYSAFANTLFKEDAALVAIEYYGLAAVAIFELRNYFRQRVFESH